MNLLDDMRCIGNQRERERERERSECMRKITPHYNSHSKRERLNLPVGKIGNLLFGSSLFNRFGGACG
jgi:hypothetical protein